MVQIGTRVLEGHVQITHIPCVNQCLDDELVIGCFPEVTLALTTFSIPVCAPTKAFQKHVVK